MKVLLKYKWLFVIILICLVIIVVRVLHNQQVPVAGVNEQTVLVQEVTKEKKQKALELSGSVEAYNSLVVSPKYGGKIKQVLVDNGAKVTKGQTLLLIDDVQQVNARLTARSALAKARANLSNLQKNYDQICELFTAGAVSQSDVDKAKLALDSASADADSAAAAVSNAEDAYNDTRIHSTINGLIANKGIKEGQVVSAGTLLMTVQDVSSVYVVVKVNQEYISQITRGLAAEVTVDAYLGQKFQGKVDIINSAADSLTRTFEVKIMIANPDSLLKPGMFAQSKISLGLPADVVSIPQTAVSGKEGMYYVFMAEDNKAKRQLVEIGDIMDKNVEIKSGIKEGQKIIVTNINKLKDGDLIKITDHQ